jgi:hypothetical protein
MNGQTLVENIRQERQTELERLGSDKALLAATNADLESRTVLAVVAATTGSLRETFDSWAGAADGDVADAFAAAAETTGETTDTLQAELDDGAAEGPASVAVLETFEAERARIGGGLIGHGLVFDRLLLQVINFFVNEADERHADQFRDVRAAANGRIQSGAALLDDVIEREPDWDRPAAAAHQVVEAAYEEYVETLNGLGIDPKPVC